jgi:uncharacterized membrane protein
MSQVHLHLFINHLPVFGSLLGALVLGYGLWSKSNQTKTAAYLLFIISAIGAGIAYLTGEGAEEAVEGIQGVSEQVIKVHEESAAYALVSLIILGAFSLFVIFITNKNIAIRKTTALIALFISLVSFGLVAWTGYLGGQIRHTEITNGNIQNNGGGGGGEKDND